MDWPEFRERRHYALRSPSSALREAEDGRAFLASGSMPVCPVEKLELVYIASADRKILRPVYLFTGGDEEDRSAFQAIVDAFSGDSTE